MAAAAAQPQQSRQQRRQEERTRRLPDAAKVALRNRLDQRLASLRQDRVSWWLHWKEVADYFLPRRYKWLITPNQANRGSPINHRIIDSHATVAMRTLASGLFDGKTSPGRPWVRFATHNEALNQVPRVKAWLAEAARRVLLVMAESNYYAAKAVQYLDLVAFGTAPMIISEDFADVIRCYNPCAGEYFIATDSRGAVDTLYREFTWTVKQIVDEFGLENVGEVVRDLYLRGKDGLAREFVVGHAIEPNDRRIEDSGNVAQLFKWREVYWLVGGQGDEILRIKGYHESPFTGPRYNVVSNDAYGRSPAMDALGDAKQLQVEQKRKGQGIDKHVNPLLLADIRLKNQPSSAVAGDITYVAGLANVAGMKPVYEVAPDLSGLVEDFADVRARTDAVFFKDFFLMISQLDTVRMLMTARRCPRSGRCRPRRDSCRIAPR